MQFWVRAYREAIPAKARNVILLTKNSWDDYGYTVKFNASYIDVKGSEWPLGALKILQKEIISSKEIVKSRTELPAVSFSKLGPGYISLGQTEKYYKNIFDIIGRNVQEVLEALADIAWSPALAADFEPDTAFRNALLRENVAQRARRFGRAWATGETPSEALDFEYLCEIEGADTEIATSINFDAEDMLPGRIVGVIGRNAVGKTRFMAKLGADLAQISRTSAESFSKREQRFPAGKPLFTRIIAISYSAFDRFKRPPQDATTSYVYCGIRNDKGTISRSGLIDNYKHNQQRIRALGQQSDWARNIKRILGELGETLEEDVASEAEQPDTEAGLLSKLSSGQAILCHFVTALLAWIQPNSLILFDEPETHLHPNAVASLFLVLTEILENHDSYAILATHSPIVIQEIPAKRVIVFTRVGNSTLAEKLTLESFGESITELTRHVFETIEVESIYKRTLRNIAIHENFEDALASFDQGLSMSAQAYLIAQYAATKE